MIFELNVKLTAALLQKSLEKNGQHRTVDLDYNYKALIERGYWERKETLHVSRRNPVKCLII